MVTAALQLEARTRQIARLGPQPANCPTGVILLDSSGDSVHRAFGCLYGVGRYGGNPVGYVPRSVAIASGIQKLVSAVLIFLFGLAVRNMLKVE